LTQGGRGVAALVALSIKLPKELYKPIQQLQMRGEPRGPHVEALTSYLSLLLMRSTKAFLSCIEALQDDVAMCTLKTLDQWKTGLEHEHVNGGSSLVRTESYRKLSRAIYWNLSAQ
jgi:hypothetical protein